MCVCEIHTKVKVTSEWHIKIPDINKQGESQCVLIICMFVLQVIYIYMYIYTVLLSFTWARNKLSTIINNVCSQ